MSMPRSGTTAPFHGDIEGTCKYLVNEVPMRREALRYKPWLVIDLKEMYARAYEYHI